MIIINNINKKEINKKRTFVISDFDRTITTQDSTTSWSVINNSDLVDNSYKIDSRTLYNYYRQIELNSNISLEDKKRYMEEWTIKEVELLKKYNIDKSMFYKILSKSNRFILRPDFKEFYNRISELGIRLYIISGGIYDSIEYILKRDSIPLEKITIISNKLKFDNNQIIGIDGNIITSCNKDSISLPIGKEEHGLLFGDIPEDKNMGNLYDTYDIIFNNDNNPIQNKMFNMSLTDSSSFSSVSKILIKGYKK